MKESALEKKVTAYAKSLGCLVLKFVSPNMRGVPDRVFITPAGACLWIEFKAPGKKPTPLQTRMLKKLRAQNVVAGWVDSEGYGRVVINECMACPESFNSYHPL